MVTPGFTHDGPGTPPAAWREHPRWRSAGPVTLHGVRRLVVLAAHPDDESLGAGGLVATASRAGLQVDVVCATDGEGSHPGSPTTTPDQLAGIRRQEAEDAAEALGVPAARLHRLALPDGGLDRHREAVTTALVELVGDGRDCVIAAPWRADGHPDHDAAGLAAAAAARRTDAELWEYPIWYWHRSEPDEAPWDRLHPFLLDAAAVTAKASGIAAHRSQVTPLSEEPGDETLLGPGLLAHFDGPVEHFLATPGEECPDDALDDLHRQQDDPWGVESRWYEERKRDLVLAALPRAHFGRGLEIGCSTGALAERLADRCDRLVAVDRSAAAVEAASRRFLSRSTASVLQLDLPSDWPEGGPFDLVVVSEVGYFLSPAALEDLVRRVGRDLSADGVVVLCHWRHRVEGWPLDADAVHAGFEAGSATRDLPELPELPELQATYRDRDVEIRVHAATSGWPDPLR